MELIVDKPIFDQGIYRLEETDRVRGGLTGNSNKQAISLANRTLYLRNLLENLSVRDVISVNRQIGEVKLTPEDVGSDPSGTAEEMIRLLVETDVPFNGYMTISKATDEFVAKGTGNTPNGPFKLNDQGKVPAELFESIVVRYIVVENEVERLTLDQIDNLTLCFQNDTGLIYYLNAGEDPSNLSLWLEGNSRNYADILSVFGRSDDVSAEVGDYTTDQISTTDDREFATPEEITAWNSKLQQLKSGDNIKYLNGVSLLGAGDLPLTPLWFGVSDRNHTHTPESLQGLEQTLSSILSQRLKEGSGINIQAEEGTGKLIINLKNDGSSNNYVVVKCENAVVGNNYTYLFSDQINYGLNAFALKESVDEDGSLKWTKQTTNQVNIRIGARDVSFVPNYPGNYYFSYEVP